MLIAKTGAGFKFAFGLTTDMRYAISKYDFVYLFGTKEFKWGEN